MATVPSGTRFIGIATTADLVERKSAVLNKQTEPYTIEDIASSVTTASQGPQGVPGVQGEQGIPGTAGAVGPAGLTWRSTWVSGTSYVANDAVSYDGASWFCILATSGTTAPDLDATHWALLASQGAQGIQGIQGIPGQQGIQGIQGSPAAQTLQETVDLGNTINTSIAINNGTFDFSLSSGSAVIEQLSTGQSTGVYHDKLTFGKNTYTTQLTPASTLTDDRVIILPNESGTIALLSDIPLATTPTLDEVLEAGNAAMDRNAIFASSAGAQTAIFPGFININNGSSTADLYYNNLSFTEGGGIIELRPPNTITGVRTLTLPDASGTVALQKYKSYVAKITHGEGNAAPTAVVLENTIGTVTWNYDEPFNYFLSSSGLFTLNKTVIFATSPSYPLMKVGVSTNNANFVGLTTDVDGFANLMFEIRVYN
jgi:hypothetical protein